MAISPKAVASWGLLAEPGRSTTQVIDEMEIVVAATEPLAVALEGEAIIVELSDSQ
jgi:hypothetical protein